MLRTIVEWIASLESGRQFRKLFSILLKICGVLGMVGAIVWGIMLLVGAIVVIPTTLRVIGAILGFCVSAINGTILIMLFWNRSNKVSSLSDESHFTLIPIVVVFTRLLGETCFIMLIAVGLQVLIVSIFGFGIPGLENFFLQVIPISIGVIGGVTSLVAAVVTGLILLIVSYIIADRTNLFLDMATNLKKIETMLVARETTPDS